MGAVSVFTTGNYQAANFFYDMALTQCKLEDNLQQAQTVIHTYTTSYTLKTLKPSPPMKHYVHVYFSNIEYKMHIFGAQLNICKSGNPVSCVLHFSKTPKRWNNS